MSEIDTIQAVQRSIVEGPAWHGPAVLPLLKDLTSEQAAAHPIPGRHSIWELVLHMDAWQQVVIRALQHHDVAILEGDADFPPVGEVTEERWKDTVDRFKKNSQKARTLLDDYDNQALRENVPGQDYPLKIVVHGISHHNAYHAGQIALLRRILENA